MTSPIFTLLLVLVLLIALFPALFHFLWSAPLSLLSILFFPSTSSTSSSPSTTPPSTMSWTQKSFTLPPRARGCHLVTDDVLRAVPEIKSYSIGLLHLFVQHTSCALSLNENWDSDVRADMAGALDRIVPESDTLYAHDAEGLDDMPAHIKTALVGSSVSIPITNGKLATGTWQGIWYMEFRDGRQTRKVVATIQGQKA